MIVYRIEDAYAGGPYNGPNGRPMDRRLTRRQEDLLIEAMYTPWDHPAPRDDVPDFDIDDLGYNASSWKFGFASQDQLKRWFGKAIPFLLDKFYVAKYEVDEKAVITGGHQVAFDTQKAKLLIREPITKTSDPVNRS